ncbi:hypothetical protein NQ318_016058 [Aromia moschata]|uniref:Uncharacterized protein n=1 Tax=Aromia moschata TaxID=1265417 RepID=A0AAV8XSU6_9CUCU|nr:hypothetical protein NQ318_016058 [Aromia moschata]
MDNLESYNCFTGVVLLERKKNEKKMEKWKLVPPDGDWGWLVLFGATMVNVLVPGTIKSFGVLFVEFMEAFNSSPAEGMWIPALCYFLYSSLGPISSILSVRYSYRVVTVLGGICTAAGMILSFWASSVYYLYFTYGILVGCGAGLSFLQHQWNLHIGFSFWFNIDTSFASIALSGIRIQGAVLIMGGITLNVFVAALFYDKVELHMKRVPINQNDEDESAMP